MQGEEGLVGHSCAFLVLFSTQYLHDIAMEPKRNELSFSLTERLMSMIATVFGTSSCLIPTYID